VTNILEALDCVSRKSKNVYKWHGTTHMAQTIKKLRVREWALDAALVSCRPRMPESFAQHVHAPVRWFGSRACPRSRWGYAVNTSRSSARSRPHHASPLFLAL